MFYIQLKLVSTFQFRNQNLSKNSNFDFQSKSIHNSMEHEAFVGPACDVAML